MLYNFQVSECEEYLLNTLIGIAQNNKNITNLLIFGSRGQKNCLRDEFSDLDIMILTKKSVDVLLLNQAQFVCFKPVEKSNSFIHYDYVLQDFRCGSIFIASEKTFKKLLNIEPFIWGSAICKGVNKLISKNNVLDFCSKLKIKRPVLEEYLTNISIDKLIYSFMNLLRVKLRNENSQTYLYGREIQSTFEKLVTLKLQYMDYCKYQEQNLSTEQMLSSYEGRHFEKYASQRQKDIMELLYCATSISKEKIIDLLNHIYDEIKECAELCSVTIDFQSLDDLKIYTSSLVYNNDDWEKYSKKKRRQKEKQCKKMLELFTRVS